MSLLEKIKLLEKKKDNPDQLSLDLDGADDKRSKAQKFTDKINKKNKNRKEFEFDPKTKERQTFKGKISSGPDKGKGYTIFRRDGGDVKKGVDKGVPVSPKRDLPIEKTSPAHRDLFKRYKKGESKATQFMIDLAKDDRKARGLGKRAERVKDASGGKKTGSLRKGNLSLPGDRTGAYSRTKAEIEFNKALKKARGNTEGDIPKEAPKSVRDYAKSVRDKRIKKYKLPDTSFDAKPSKKPIRPFGDAPVKTGIDKPTVPKKKTFKVFSQGTKKKAIDDIRASDKRLYDAGVGKKPSLVQQRKFAKDVFRKAQQKQTAEFNKQQRLAKMYDAYDDGDLGNPEFSKSKPKNVKFSSGARGEFPSGSVETGGEMKKFAGRNRTPAPQVNKPVVNRTPPKVNQKYAKDAIPVSRTPFDSKPENASRRTVNYTDTNKPISRKVKNSKGTGNIYRDNPELKKLKIEADRAAAGYKKGPTKPKPVGQSATLDNRLINKGTRNFSGVNPNVKGPYSNIFNKNKIKDTTTGKKKVDLLKFGKKSGVTNPSFLSKTKAALKPTASKILKMGPLKKYAAAAAIVGAGLYGADRINKKFFAGKDKKIPAIKGDVIRYKESGKKKYFDLSKDFKKGYITKDDFKDMNPDSKTYGQVDAGFKKGADDNLIKRIKSANKK